MALEQILQALEGETAQQTAQIARAAAEQIAEIGSAARAEAAQAYQEAIDAIQAPLQIEQARILNRARLEALQLVLRAREQLMESALEAGTQHLVRFCTGAGYPRLLRQLTSEAVAALQGEEELQLSVRPRDVALMMAIVDEMGIQALVTGDLTEESAPAADRQKVLGGLLAATQDGRIQLNNTINMRLRRVSALYRAQLAEIVFGNGQEV